MPFTAPSVPPSVRATTQPDEEFEWYLIETSHPGTPSPAHRPTRLGPFASEAECRAVLDSARQIRRFSASVFEVHKQRERDQRFRLQYPVRLCSPGTDRTLQLARTIDLSLSGACLAGVKVALSPGDVLTVHHGDRQALFQVVWVGSGAGADRCGLKCLAPEVNIWKLDSFEITADHRLPREIERARAVQDRLFPQHMPALRTLDYSGHCIQARNVGGDYYDFLPFAPGDLGLVLADVSGKGLAAALLMANLHGSLQAQCALGSRDPLRLLAEVNRHLHKHTEAHRYVTLFLGCYDDRTRRLRYVNCGHNPPLLLRREGATHWLDATATVLGLFPEWEGTVGETQVEPGDIVSMFTDGVTEAHDAHGEEFGEARLIRTLRMNHDLEAASLLDKVEQAVDEFRSGDRHDDLTMIIARGA